MLNIIFKYDLNIMVDSNNNKKASKKYSFRAKIKVLFTYMRLIFHATYILLFE